MTDLGHADFNVKLVGATCSLGAVIFISAFVYDFTVPKNPIFPFKLFKMFREFTAHLIILFFSGMVWYVGPLPQPYYQKRTGMLTSPLPTGKASSPSARRRRSTCSPTTPSRSGGS